ncbi:MAG: hypothetical protein PVJ67_01895 [Candidatus Pacearchaeota archaeon]|jgi:hypothetical protein
MKKNKTNTRCLYYNFGGDFDKGYAPYPKSFGARCEYHRKFFSKDKGKLNPDCGNCIKSLDTLVVIK